MRGHFETAEFDETEAAVGGIGRVKFVDAEFGAMGVAGEIDEEVSEDAVHDPGRGVELRRRWDLAEGDFEFVEIIGAAFVGAGGLAGWADEGAGEEVRE